MSSKRPIYTNKEYRITVAQTWARDKCIREGRAHRMGQVRKVQVHRLILPDSVDEQMLSMLAIKQSEFDDYARDSELANSVKVAKDSGDESIAKVIIMQERDRLGIKASTVSVILDEQE